MNVAYAYGNFNETRTYNTLGQLTGLSNGAENLTYNYPTGTNNGKIASKSNAVSGETVAYQYDSLNRLASAAATSGTWGEAYTYDGFGNLTAKTVTAGSGPSLSVTTDGNNHIAGVWGFSYDGNGNALYNGAPAIDYDYDAQNKRIWTWTAGTADSLGNMTNYQITAYSVSGQKLGTYTFVPGVYANNGVYTPIIFVTLQSSDQYFGGRRLAVMDQLGSAGTYYPWGEAKGGTNPQDAWSYATYWRDSATGLDYANNRYYSNQYARFMTPDPYKANGGGAGDPRDPQTWNKYTYAGSDPVNMEDPAGLQNCPVEFGICTSDPGPVEGPGPYPGGGGGLVGTNDDGSAAVRKNPWDILGMTKAQYVQYMGAMKRHDYRDPNATDCDSAVSSSMKNIWAQSMNGTSGKEATFVLVGTPDNYTIVQIPFTNESMSQTFNLPAGTFAIYHVHPAGGDPSPSPQDEAIANEYDLSINTISSQGLYEYDPGDKSVTQLTQNLDWSKPCASYPPPLPQQ